MVYNIAALTSNIGMLFLLFLYSTVMANNCSKRWKISFIWSQDAGKPLFITSDFVKFHLANYLRLDMPFNKEWSCHCNLQWHKISTPWRLLTNVFEMPVILCISFTLFLSRENWSLMFLQDFEQGRAVKDFYYIFSPLHFYLYRYKV